MGVGIGYGSYSRANSISEESQYWVDPHNELLHKALESGIFGVLLFLLLLFSAFKDGWKLSHCRGKIKEFGIGFLAGTVGFWLCGLVHVVLIGSPGILYWCVAGAVLGATENDDYKIGANKIAHFTDNSKT